MKLFKTSPHISSQRGDTIIEVLLALAVVSAVAVGAVTVMNRGLLQNVSATEFTKVRQYINQQSEFLHYIRDSYVASTAEERDEPPAVLWNDNDAGRRNSVHEFTASTADEQAGGFIREPCQTGGNSKSFYIKQGSGGLNDLSIEPYGRPGENFPETSSTPGNGLWINVVFKEASPNAPGYADFYIKACWSSLSGDTNQQVRSVVRLYDALD